MPMNPDGTYKNPNNSQMFRALDTHEIAGGNPSMEDSFADYATTGVYSAVVSAGVGLYNTGAALGEVLGMVEEGNQLDEGETVNSLLGADAAAFYGRHKAGIDAGGLAIGSLAPGLLAVKGLRMLQIAGKVTPALEGATGLRNADIVMNSPAVEAAKKYALQTTTAQPNWFSGPMIKAYAQGYKQQVMEAAAFEAATLVTMNQQATLNPDDVGYFTAIGDNFWHSTQFALFGGALGGSIDALRVFGSVRKHGNMEWERTADLKEVRLGNMQGMAGGNQLIELSREAARRAELGKDLASTDWFGKKQLAHGDNILKTAMLEAMGDLNKAGNPGYKVLEELVKDGSTAQLESIATMVSGMRELGNVSVKDLEELSAFYAKTRSPSFISTSQNFDSLLGDIASQQNEFISIMNKVTKDPANKVAFDALKFNEGLFKAADPGSAGFAFVGDSLRNSTDDVFNVRVVKMDDITTAVIPDFIGLNERNLKSAYQTSAMYARAIGQEFTHTQESFNAYVLLHELGHIKNNSRKSQILVANVLAGSETGEASKMVEQLITASLRGRESSWFSSLNADFRNMTEAQKVSHIMTELKRPGGNLSKLGGPNGLGSPTELLADGAAYMTGIATRELGSKHFPELAKMFDAEGALAKSWNPTKGYFNSRTKQVYSSYLPGIADVDQNLHVTLKGLDTKLVSPTLNRSFNLVPELFQDAKMIEALATKVDHLEFDAQWIMADKQTYATLVNKDGVINIAENNLPIMEKVAVLAQKDPQMQAAFGQGKVMLNGQVVMAESLPELVKQRKQDLRILLSSGAARYNEQEVARMLNIDIPHAMGVANADESGWLLLGAKDYTKPEVFTMKYDHRSINDYQGAVMNMAGVSMLNDAVKSQHNATAALLTGELFTKLPELGVDLLAGLNPFASRATMTSNARTTVGSLREGAAYVGKLVGQYIVNKVEEVDKGFTNFASRFNRTDSGAIRFELAQLDNILRREHYYMVTTAEGANYAVRKDVFRSKMEGLFGSYHSDMRKGLPDDEVSVLVGTGDAWAPDAIKMGDDVASLMSSHSATNASVVDRKIELARAKGFYSTLDRDVLYAPPRDLKQQKYFALVEPSRFKEGSDPRRFMIYGETAAELESKKLAIQQKYGNDYNIDTTAERMAQMRAGKTTNNLDAFDEAEFDVGLFSKGASSELSPNVDMLTSATLERYRTWTIRQEEHLVRAGVELKYGDLFAQMGRLNKEFAKDEANTLNKRWQEASTIWKDTSSTMLNQRARGSALEQEWVRVNDFVGEKGSQFLDNSFSTFRKFKDAPIDQATLMQWNKELDDAGYKSPFDDIAQVVLSSPETTKSNLFPATVRILSKLIGTTMLRLDQVNSMMQVLATPILTLPVLMEAKLALKGTPQGARLDAATTVTNPVTKQAEPNVVKLMATAFTKFHTDEGKAFIKELRDRNIITDELQRYHEVTDLSQLNGRHTMHQANAQIDKLAKYGSYLSAGNFAETYSRFVTAWAVKDLCEIRGLAKDEAWATISGSVDKVHGIYAGAQRPQLFQGVLGQSIGLFQTYFFNFAQALMKNVAEGSSKQTATMLGMQSSIFGIQSLPGFQTLNATIGESNRKNTDLYAITNADSGESWGQYAMYGMASHMFGAPTDFTTRGSLANRNILIIPTQFQDLPIVGTIGKAVGNIIDTGMMAAEGDVGIGRALLHGLAHNAMNRPLQGVGQIMMGNTDTISGQNNQENINRLGYDANADLNWAGMFARAIGTKPLNETIVQNSYFRTAAYKANTVRELADIGGKIQMNAQTGELTPASYASFARDYELAGGEIQSFNAYWGRQLKQAGNGTMSKFRDEMTKQHSGELGRSAFRIAQKQSTLTPWDAELAGEAGK